MIHVTKNFRHKIAFKMIVVFLFIISIFIIEEHIDIPYEDKIWKGLMLIIFIIMYQSIIKDAVKEKELIENIFREIPKPLSISYIDKECKIQYANDEFAKLMGYTNANEIIGKEPEGILGMQSSYVKDIINRGEPIVNERRESIINKDSVSLYYPMIIPIKDTSAEVIGGLEILHDVTKLIEQQIITEQIVENMPYPVHLVFFGLDRKIQYADNNYIRLVGYKRIDEIKGKSLREILSISDETKLMVEKVFETKNPIINKEMKIKTFDNKTVYVLCSCMPINDAFGNLFGVLKILGDITELKNTQNSLIMRNKELEAYAYTVAHDLRTPLITVQYFANTVEKGIEQNKKDVEEAVKYIRNLISKMDEELEDHAYTYTTFNDLRTPLITLQNFANIVEKGLEQNKKDVEESLEYIKKSISKMDDLLSDTLRLSSIDYDKSLFKLVSFNTIVINAIKRLSTQIETRGVKLIKAQDFPVVFVNELRITEMLINLIENSIKFIGEDNQNPVIEIGYKGDENNAVFFVKDNGIGIDSSQHEKIFNIFYKVDPNTKGTGIGLAIVKKIINAHNGEVWVESELEKGTTIFFTLSVME